MINTFINGKYNLLLPEHRAARPQWLIENGGWEVERIEAMVKQLQSKENQIVFDVGTEAADITALLSKYTNCDLLMFEPNERVFGCINEIWKGNNLKKPLGFFKGFLSDKTTDGWRNDFSQNLPQETSIIPDHGFKQLYENYPDVSQVTLDEFCDITGIYPDIITIDVEGSEQNVMRGAEKTLREKKPIIFMSVHPEFMYESYRNEGIWKERYGERQHVVHMLRFIDELGYTHRCIEYDYHELHMCFEPK